MPEDQNHVPVSGSPDTSLTNAVRLILRPLAGLLLDHGLTYGWLTRILKIIFVEVAEEQFKLPDKQQTDSRISLLTGIHRKDVRKLRSEQKTGFEPPSSIFLGAQLIAIWTTDRRFLDESGLPAPLPRYSGSDTDSSRPSFENLVIMVSKDIRPRAILDEWIRLGAVKLNSDSEVVPNFDAFIPAKSFEDKAYYLGRNIHDHLAAVRSNVRNDDPPFIERCVYIDNLSESSIKSLANQSEVSGMETLKQLYANGTKLQQKDKKDSAQNAGAKHRMSFGIYFYSDKHD